MLLLRAHAAWRPIQCSFYSIPHPPSGKPPHHLHRQTTHQLAPSPYSSLCELSTLIRGIDMTLGMADQTNGSSPASAPASTRSRYPAREHARKTIAELAKLIPDEDKGKVNMYDRARGRGDEMRGSRGLELRRDVNRAPPRNTPPHPPARLTCTSARLLGPDARRSPPGPRCRV